jgi:hypothetical protein
LASRCCTKALEERSAEKDPLRVRGIARCVSTPGRNQSWGRRRVAPAGFPPDHSTRGSWTAAARIRAPNDGLLVDPTPGREVFQKSGRTVGARPCTATASWLPRISWRMACSVRVCLPTRRRIGWKRSSTGPASPKPRRRSRRRGPWRPNRSTQTRSDKRLELRCQTRRTVRCYGDV